MSLAHPIREWLSEEKAVQTRCTIRFPGTPVEIVGAAHPKYEKEHMMNHRIFGKKVSRDVEHTIEDLATLGDDNVAGLARVKKDLVTLGDDGVAGLNRKFEQITEDTKETVAATVKTLNNNVSHGLSQYNSKIQDVADRIPGDFSKKAAGYPWVTVALSLVFGLLLGILIKPGRQPVG